MTFDSRFYIKRIRTVSYISMYVDKIKKKNCNKFRISYYTVLILEI